MWAGCSQVPYLSNSSHVTLCPPLRPPGQPMHLLVNLALGSEATEFTKRGGRGVTQQELEVGGWVLLDPAAGRAGHGFVSLQMRCVHGMRRLRHRHAHTLVPRQMHGDPAAGLD